MGWNAFQGRPIDMSGTAQANLAYGQLRQRRDELRRQEEQRFQSQKSASAAAVDNALEQKNFNTGTALDPRISQMLNQAREKGFELAAKGVNSADIMMALAPQLSQINTYSIKAKAAQAKKKEALKTFANQPGYDLSKLDAEYDNEIFYKVDPTTGQRVLREVDEINPEADPIKNILINRPETVTDASGLKAFLDKVPMQEKSYEDVSEKGGIINKTRYKYEVPEFMDISKDAAGVPALRVKGSPIMDGDKAILGQDGQPAMAVDKNTYNWFMKREPGAADFIRGEVRKSFPKDKVPPEDSPAWEMQARHIIYDEFNRGNKAKLSYVDSERLNPDGRKVDAVNSGMIPAIRIYNEQTPRPRAAGRTKAPAENITTTEAIARVFTNDPEYIAGEVVDVDGREMIDVTYTMPKGTLKYGTANDDVYKGIYYDPEAKELIVEDKYGNKRAYNEGNVGQLMSATATLNRSNLGKVGKISDARSTLEKYGYKDGKFTGAQQADTSPIAEARKARQEAAAAQIDTFESDGDVKAIQDQKGKETKDGKIVKIAKSSRFNPTSDYYIEVEKGGKKKEISFKSAKSLADYLRGGAPTPSTKKALFD